MHQECPAIVQVDSAAISGDRAALAGATTGNGEQGANGGLVLHACSMCALLTGGNRAAGNSAGSRHQCRQQCREQSAVSTWLDLLSQLYSKLSHSPHALLPGSTIKGLKSYHSCERQ
jgi:hypothetical protein